MLFGTSDMASLHVMLDVMKVREYLNPTIEHLQDHRLEQSQNHNQLWTQVATLSESIIRYEY